MFAQQTKTTLCCTKCQCALAESTHKNVPSSDVGVPIGRGAATAEIGAIAWSAHPVPKPTTQELRTIKTLVAEK